MANSIGFGLIPERKINGGELFIHSYVIPASDGTAVFAGDVVKLSTTLDTVSQLPTCVIAASTNTMLGVVVGFLPSPINLLTGSYRLASTRRVALVMDDPLAVYTVLEDANGGAIPANDVGQMYYTTLVVTAGSTVTNLSGTMISSANVSSSSSGADVRIVGVARTPGNVAGQAAGAVLEVILINTVL